ncbi:polysaccharide deacetylase family protein [Xanthomarina gelatinilytica]|uniref:polysaccharide deacetylase family protein n=1 Tax=Xanthomarina gelatinilytica TaxID=1137281 RepID=UPI003AA8B287
MNRINKILLLSFFVLGSIYTSNSQNRKIAITIDDLLATPADENEYEYITDNLLKTLTKNNIKAIGFVNESRLYTDEKPDSSKIKILEKWMTSDMQLGNHTFSHVYINNTSIEEYKKDVIKGELITRPLLKKYNQELKYFRHPQLRTGPTDEYRSELTSFLKDRGYTIAPVTIDNDEYIHAFCYANAKREGNKALMDKIGKDYIEYMASVFNFYEKLSASFLGYEVPQTLLIHANNLNADYLDELVTMMTSRGYEFVSIDEALKNKTYKMPEGTHSRGPSWIQRWMIAKGKNPESHPPVSKFIDELYQKYRSQ